jgi:hypothetical protein
MPERSFRFAVTDGQGKRAGSWKCFTFTGKGKHDVYLTCREIGQTCKVSLHQSGVWRIAWLPGVLEMHLELPLPPDRDRVMLRWERPPEIAPGITLALRLLVTSGAVCVPENPPLPAGTIRLNAPPVGQVVEVSFVYTPQVAKFTHCPGQRAMGTELVGSLDLDNGERVWAVHRRTDMPHFPLQHGQMTRFKGAAKVDWSDPRVRWLGFGRDDGGAAFIVESRVMGLSDQLRDLPHDPTLFAENGP